VGRRNFQPAREENPGSEKKGGSEGGARRAPELSHSSLSLSPQLEKTLRAKPCPFGVVARSCSYWCRSKRGELWEIHEGALLLREASLDVAGRGKE
jgi:hypothetical protein